MSHALPPRQRLHSLVCIFAAPVFLLITPSCAIGLRGKAASLLASRALEPADGIYSYHAAPQGGQGNGMRSGMPMPPGVDANGGISYGNAEPSGAVSPARTNSDGSIAYPSAYKDVTEAALMSEQFQSGALQAAIAGDQHNGVVDNSEETMQQLALKRQMAATQAIRKSTNGIMKMQSLMQNHDASYADVLSAVDWMAKHDGTSRGSTQTHLYLNDHQSEDDLRRQGTYVAREKYAKSDGSIDRSGEKLSAKSGWTSGPRPDTASSSEDRNEGNSGDDIGSASTVMQQIQANRRQQQQHGPKLKSEHKKAKRQIEMQKNTKLEKTLNKLKADLEKAKSIDPLA